MDFKTLRALKAMVDAHNKVPSLEKIDFWFPHMFADGKWAVVLVFGDSPELKEMAPFLSFALANSLHSFLMQLNGDIAVNYQ